MKKMHLVLLAPILLSSCMMLGIGGMGMAGGGAMDAAAPGSSMNGKTLIKEAEVNGTRITVELPSYAIGDALSYRVTIRDVATRAIASNVSVALIVTSSDSVAMAVPSAPAGSHRGHGEPSMTQREATAKRLMFAPSGMDNGTYVFRPSITNAGTYTFLFRVERVGNVTMTPPIEVEQSIQLDARSAQRSGHGAHEMGSRLAPAALIGAGAMAVGMLFMLR